MTVDYTPDEHGATLEPSRAITYITTGKGKATLVGESRHYTYKFGHPDDHNCVWVKLLVEGSDTYKYIGFIPTTPTTTRCELVAGRKGNPSHPAFKGLAWYLHHAQNNPEVAKKLTFYHEGRCCKCSSPLTNPLSIELGIGPKCRGDV